MERGGGRGLGDGLSSWKGKKKRSSMNVKTEKEKTERPAAWSPDPFARAMRESIGIEDGGPGYYPWAGPSADFSYELETWLETRDRDPEATYRADVRRNDEALQRMKRKVLAAEYSNQQPNQQQQHSTLQPGSWLGEQQHLQYLMPGPYLQPGEQQQSADLTFELDPSSDMRQMEDLNAETTFDIDMSTGEVMLQIQTEVVVASGQQHSGHSSFGPSALHGEPQHSTPSSSQPGSLSGENEQQHAECLMPGPSSKSGECSHSSSKTDELPGSSPGLQQHSVHSEPVPSSRSGEQQHLDPAPAGGSLPTEQQNSDKFWDTIFRPTGRPGKWQLDRSLSWLPVPFPEDLLPADVSRRMQQQRSSSQTTGVGRRQACSSQPGDRRHPVASSSQPGDRRHPVAYSSQLGDRRHPVAYSSQPGDRRHPVAYSSRPDDPRRHPVALSALHGEPQHSTPGSSQPGSLSGEHEQQHAECLMPGPSSKSGDCSHSASMTDELPGSSPGLQQHSVHSEPVPSSRSGEQQHLDPAAAGGSLPTEQQNSDKSWELIFRPTGRPGKWQLDRSFSWLPVPFPEDLLPADVSRRMQQQRSSSQTTGVGRRQACSSQPGDRRHPVASSSQPGDRRHPVAYNSQPGDRRHPVANRSQPRDHRLPPLSSKSGDQRRHPVASSSRSDDPR